MRSVRDESEQDGDREGAEEDEDESERKEEEERRERDHIRRSLLKRDEDGEDDRCVGESEHPEPKEERGREGGLSERRKEGKESERSASFERGGSLRSSFSSR